MWDPDPADALVRNAVGRALSRLEGEGLQGPAIREREHFDPAVKSALCDLGGKTVAAKQLPTEHFPGIGAVDVTVAEPPILLELKWSYNEDRSKIFESLWDAIKLALLGSEHRRFGYIATGASNQAWRHSECADLFEQESVSPRAMWNLPLIPPGPNGGTTVGEDLVRGSPSAAQPLAAPERLSVRQIERIGVRGGYEARVVRVATDGPLQTL